MIHPPTLVPGARVALIAPAGPLRGPEDIERALANARVMGWEGIVASHALDRSGYFAGTDADRLADLNAAITDDRVDAIWCLRGGYGSMRLLDGVRFDRLRERPKAVLGYSDITALHCAINARAGIVSYHAPVARAPLPPFAAASLRHAVSGEESCGEAPGSRTLVGGIARGRLVGTNLALLCALTGTAYAPDYTGAIMVLEDVNEEVYRIDRMLCHLRLSGAFDRCAGIVFGAFTDIPAGSDDPAEPEGERSAQVARLLEETARLAGVPCIAGAPVGHMEQQWTIPLGSEATLYADECRLVVGRGSWFGVRISGA